MSWDWLRGHQRQVSMFRDALQADRLASTFLFIGKPGIGKQLFAVELAKALLCETNAEMDFEACDQCPSCVQVAADTHPDVIRVRKPDDKAYLPIDLFIGDRDHRMRTGLCHDISLKPFSGRRKVAIIDDADFFNQESANCLLKTLEEPPPGSLIILIGTSEQKQLPTIRSRSQVIRFQPLSDSDVQSLLLEEQPDLSSEQAAASARQAEGSMTIARWLCDETTQAFRRELLQGLADPHVNTIDLAAILTAYVDSGGSDGAVKRAKMRQAAQIAAIFYRDVLLMMTGASVESIDEHVLAAASWFGGEGIAVECLERCIALETQIDANVNSSNWIECFVDGLTRSSILG